VKGEKLVDDDKDLLTIDQFALDKIGSRFLGSDGLNLLGDTRSAQMKRE
jgi:hypothetical protein